MTFEEALKLMREGKLLKRSYDRKPYIQKQRNPYTVRNGEIVEYRMGAIMDKDGKITRQMHYARIVSINTKSLMADDWELVGGKHDN